MAKWDAGTITTNGVEVPVQVDDLTGAWTAEYAGRSLSHETRDKLEAALKRLTKVTRVEVAVPVIRVARDRGWGIGNIRILRGVLTGVHSGNGNVLATWNRRGEDAKEQITRDNTVIYVGGDTSDADLDEYNRLLRLDKETRNKIRDWERAHEIQPKDAVETAVRAKAGSED